MVLPGRSPAALEGPQQDRLDRRFRLITLMSDGFPFNFRNSTRGPELRAIILAAGKGSRLEPVSGESVKCLVELGGMTLIERQFKYLRDCGINQIAVVVGYESERIQRICGPEVEYVENPIFAETNSLYSLWLARHL